jgi:hypothetical protein
MTKSVADEAAIAAGSEARKRDIFIVELRLRD